MMIQSTQCIQHSQPCKAWNECIAAEAAAPQLIAPKCPAQANAVSGCVVPECPVCPIPPCPVPERTLPVMVDPEPQSSMGSMYSITDALLHGTLYETLYKPMNHETISMPACPVDLQHALEFAIWELRLYLDTHPCDRNAQETLRDLKLQAQQQCEHTAQMTAAALPAWTAPEPAVREDTPEASAPAFMWPWDMDDDANER